MSDARRTVERLTQGPEVTAAGWPLLLCRGCGWRMKVDPLGDEPLAVDPESGEGLGLFGDKRRMTAEERRAHDEGVCPRCSPKGSQTQPESIDERLRVMEQKIVELERKRWLSDRIARPLPLAEIVPDLPQCPVRDACEWMIRLMERLNAATPEAAVTRAWDLLRDATKKESR